MPIFEYQCKECNTIFEKLVPGQTKKNCQCPKCSSMETEKKISRFAGIVGKSSSCSAKSICESTGHSCGGSCPMHH